MSIRYVTPACPTCGERLWGESDFLACCSVVAEQPDGTFEYTGQQHIFEASYNHNELVEGGATELVKVQCLNGHEWDTEVDYNADDNLPEDANANAEG